MKTTLKILLLALFMATSFIGGIFWEYSANQQEITEIEQVALEACDVRMAAIKKLCK